MTPATFQPLQQLTDMDCGVACVAMLTGIPQRTVGDKAVKMFARPHRAGMWAVEVVRLAAAFKLRLKRTATWDEDATGILILRDKQGDRHYAVLFQGVVGSPSDGVVYDYDTYLLAKGYGAVGLLMA